LAAAICFSSSILPLRSVTFWTFNHPDILAYLAHILATLGENDSLFLGRIVVAHRRCSKLFICLGGCSTSAMALPAGVVQAGRSKDIRLLITGCNKLIKSGWVDRNLMRMDISGELRWVPPGSLNDAGHVALVASHIDGHVFRVVLVGSFYIVALFAFRSSG
jgi:hypothetical protein